MSLGSATSRRTGTASRDRLDDLDLGFDRSRCDAVLLHLRLGAGVDGTGHAGNGLYEHPPSRSERVVVVGREVGDKDVFPPLTRLSSHSRDLRRRGRVNKETRSGKVVTIVLELLLDVGGFVQFVALFKDGRDFGFHGGELFVGEGTGVVDDLQRRQGSAGQFHIIACYDTRPARTYQLVSLEPTAPLDLPIDLLIKRPDRIGIDVRRLVEKYPFDIDPFVPVRGPAVVRGNVLQDRADIPRSVARRNVPDGLDVGPVVELRDLAGVVLVRGCGGARAAVGVDDDEKVDLRVGIDASVRQAWD